MCLKDIVSMRFVWFAFYMGLLKLMVAVGFCVNYSGWVGVTVLVLLVINGVAAPVEVVLGLLLWLRCGLIFDLLG